MKRWDEMRTAYAVARVGTISGAAEELGVHRATVVRHIDALEGELGGKLFQRHGRGYTLTEAGEDMLRVARTIDEQFDSLSGRIRGRANTVTGELVVTTVPLIAPLILPAIAEFRRLHPETRVRYEVGSRVYRLEYGEAHLAIRAGRRPAEPDNVVLPFGTLDTALYAHPDYLAAVGHIELERLEFVLDSREPVRRWLHELVDEPHIALESPTHIVPIEAIRLAMGAGFCLEALADPAWIQLVPPRPEWAMPMWLVTHIDQHRTAKVQAIVRLLRDFAVDSSSSPLRDHDLSR